MSVQTTSASGGKVVILAPFGRDAAVLAEIVRADGKEAVICDKPDDWEKVSVDSTSAIIATEEGLLESSHALETFIGRQPKWSELPTIILSGGRRLAGSTARWGYLSRFGNALVLERPLESKALLMALKAAHRARLSQYMVRDQLEQLERQSSELERRVEDRTRALRIEVEERRRVESALNAARRLEAIGRLTGGVAHDFNNLLQVIRGASALLRRVVDRDQTVVGLLDTIDRAGEKAGKLTHQLLAFARKQPLNVDSVDVGRLIQDMADLLQQSVREKVTLYLTVAPTPLPVSIDGTQLEVALLNLVVNAKDAMPTGGRVVVSARGVTLPDDEFPEAKEFAGEFILVSVSDAGSGMSDEVAQKAFEPFFTTKAAGAGTGLGLSQVYGFAAQSGGTAWIRTGPSGTQVFLLLPRSAASEGGFGRASQRDTQDEDKLIGVRVLLVEDDEEVAGVSVRLLETMGCIVERASNADEALLQDLSRQDIVVSDVSMPGSMDGIGLAERISKTPRAPAILLVTGYAIAPERVMGLNIRFLPKPYTPEKLQTALLGILSTR